jgi:hypothetical protein
MTTLHRHHILPKHAGGTDDASNIVLLTREQHAEAHMLRYKQLGSMKDLYAYQLLTKAPKYIKTIKKPRQHKEVCYIVWCHNSYKPCDKCKA